MFVDAVLPITGDLLWNHAGESMLLSSFLLVLGTVVAVAVVMVVVVGVVDVVNADYDDR